MLLTSKFCRLSATIHLAYWIGTAFYWNWKLWTFTLRYEYSNFRTTDHNNSFHTTFDKVICVVQFRLWLAKSCRVLPPVLEGSLSLKIDPTWLHLKCHCKMKIYQIISQINYTQSERTMLVYAQRSICYAEYYWRLCIPSLKLSLQY